MTYAETYALGCADRAAGLERRPEYTGQMTWPAQGYRDGYAGRPMRRNPSGARATKESREQSGLVRVSVWVPAEHAQGLQKRVDEMLS